MKRFIPRLGVNPIIVKELRSRMRGPRAFITLTVVLLLTGGIMFAILQIVLAASRYSSVLSPQVGQGMFAALAFLELFMISTITPAVTAGAISGEKEKQTYEMLMATPLSPSHLMGQAHLRDELCVFAAFRGGAFSQPGIHFWWGRPTRYD
jgi:ABC-2 type transport system permease protein